VRELGQWLQLVGLSTFEHLLFRLDGKNLHRVLALEFCKNVSRNLEMGMRLMGTRGGSVGRADSEAKAGDSIALLSGCSVPVILRPLKEGGWLVVEDSIIRGCM